MTNSADKLSPFIAASVVVHVGLVALVMFGPSLFASSPGEAWGDTTDKGVRVGVASSLPGIPLPSPPVVDESAKPTETKTLHSPEPAPKTPPKAPKQQPAEIKIPERGARKPSKQSEPSASSGSKAATPPPAAPDSNAIPGEGRPADLQYGSPGAKAPATFGGDGTFGTRFGWYVTAMTRAIQDQWHDAIGNVPPGASRHVSLTFTIDRDGRVSNVAVAEASGSTQLDNSARKAVLTAKLQRLPPEYRGSTVDVRFYFDYTN